VYLYPTSHAAGGVQVLQKYENFSRIDDLKAVFLIAEHNPDALSNVDFGPKRPFGVGECAMWARLTGKRFTAQVGAVVGLVEAPANRWKTTTVAKEAMAIKYGNKTSHSFDQKVPRVALR
jgi:hypothetical protein